MIARKCTMQDLENALQKVNRKYGENIRFRKLEQMNGRAIRFTLTVCSSRGPGARLGFPDYTTGKQRRLAAACWHVHGEFFDTLFALQPEAVITSQGHRITAEAGNWEDRNIGSVMRPLYFSDACECN